MDGTAFPSSKAKLFRLESELDGVRERFKRANTNWKDAVNRGRRGDG